MSRAGAEVGVACQCIDWEVWGGAGGGDLCSGMAGEWRVESGEWRVQSARAESCSKGQKLQTRRLEGLRDAWDGGFTDWPSCEGSEGRGQSDECFYFMLHGASLLFSHPFRVIWTQFREFRVSHALVLRGLLADAGTRPTSNPA